MTLPATALPAEMPAAFLGVQHSLTGKLWRDRLDARGAARALAITQRHQLPELLARVLAGRDVDIDAVADFLDPTIRKLLPDARRIEDVERHLAATELHVALTFRLDRQTERAGVELRVVIPYEPIRILGNDRALVRVLSNLVANAIAHTPQGGTVELALGADHDGAYARVDDTGVGINEADMPRLFDVAYRGSNSRVPRTDPSLPSGSGLGLAIAAALVKAHAGTLTARNLDTGARFEVRLPLAHS